MTIFKDIVNVNVNIPITLYDKEKLDYIRKQIKDNRLFEKHNIIYLENDRCKEDLDYFNLKVRSMGRNYEQDKEFFDAASTAAYYLMEACDDKKGNYSK